MMSENLDVNFYNVKKIMSEGYNRSKNIPKAGFVSGPCLLKDTMQLSAFFGGNFTDSLNESRIISRKAFDELNFDAMKMNSTQQLTIRGFKKRQKMAEIVGNEGERIGGKKKMTPLKVGAYLSGDIIKEFIKW